MWCFLGTGLPSTFLFPPKEMYSLLIDFCTQTFSCLVQWYLDSDTIFRFASLYSTIMDSKWKKLRCYWCVDLNMNLWGFTKILLLPFLGIIAIIATRTVDNTSEEDDDDHHHCLTLIPVLLCASFILKSWGNRPNLA